MIQAGGLGAVGSIAATLVGTANIASFPAGVTQTQSFTFPAVATGTLVVVSVHCQNHPNLASSTSIVYDPSGANVALTLETGLTVTPPVIASGVIPSFAGGSKTIQITFVSDPHFFQGAISCWLVTGQTINNAQNALQSTANVIVGLSVTHGQVILASEMDQSNQAWDFALSSPTTPSSVAGSGTTCGTAIWNANNTNTASYTVNGKSGVTPTRGTVAATYV
jgi:hypothetical protein